MSGSASIAAAKRRRSKVDQSRQSTSTSSNLANSSSNNNSSNNNNMPNRLTTQQSFQYIWQKLMQVESLVNNNYMNLKNNNNSNVDELSKKVASVERSIQMLSNNSTQNSKSDEADESKYVSLDQFNNIMAKVAQDMQDVSQKVADLTDYVSNVQNNNIVLRNMIDAVNTSVDVSSVGSDNSEAGLDMNTITFNNGTSLDDGSVESVNSEVDDGGVDGDDVDGDAVDVDDSDVVESSTAADISSVLDKLKTLNNDSIKKEVTEELNNNVTLTVSETNTEDEKESIV
jgi:hypothetical protein